MFHVELRRFPHSTHAFNLSEGEVQAQVLNPWREGRPAELGERRWAAEGTRVVILQGPRLAPEELGMGRGWASARRSGQDVTRDLLARADPPAPDQALSVLVQALVQRAAAGPLSPWEAWLISAQQQPGARPGEALAAAERALLVLLADGRLVLGDTADLAPAAGPSLSSRAALALLGDPAAWVIGQGPALCARPAAGGARDQPRPAPAPEDQTGRQSRS